MRILTQSDPFCSRFIQEVRYVLKQGWYYPVFKGGDPVGRILMYKVNDYLEVRDIHSPHAYLDEFTEQFERLLENYRDTLVDVALLTNFNGESISLADDTTKKAFEDIGFRFVGDGDAHGHVDSFGLAFCPFNQLLGVGEAEAFDVEHAGFPPGVPEFHLDITAFFQNGYGGIAGPTEVPIGPLPRPRAWRNFGP